jgi:hypothetical protein
VKDYLGLLVQLIVGIAWPVLAVVGFLILRKHIFSVAGSVARKIEESTTGTVNVGPVALRWNRVIEKGAQSIERSSTPVRPATEDHRREVASLTSTATEQPTVAIIEGYEQVRNRLLNLLRRSAVYTNENSDINAYELARLAASSGLIDDAVADTVGSITVLRNLSTAVPATRIDPAQAKDYVDLVEGVLYRIPA